MFSILVISIYLIYHDSFFAIGTNSKKSIFEITAIGIFNIFIYLFLREFFSLFIGMLLIILSFFMYIKQKKGESKDE